jgi:hypothetical protein
MAAQTTTPISTLRTPEVFRGLDRMVEIVCKIVKPISSKKEPVSKSA